MATTNGNLHHRHADYGSPSSCSRAWELRRKMPKSTGGNDRVLSWNLNIFWLFTTVAIVFHLFAVFAFLFLCKDRIGGGNWSKYLFPANYCPRNEQRLEISAVMEEEISVSSTSGSIPNSMDSIINLDHGDPMMYEKFWKQAGNAAELIIPGAQTMSYFSDVTNLCWFLEPEFAAEIRRLHRLVGNAVIGPDSYIIVGTGSSQLFQAALFALSTSTEVFSRGGSGGGRPLPVVSSIPYYSSYPAAADLLQSALFRWAGDASSLEKDDDDPYIEVVCSPSNPDGLIKTASIRSSSSNQNVIYDLAYYWPQYTAITAPANHDLMLFTASKCTGHAGMRLGWAIVKNRDVAKRMTKFIEISTIGVSKDSQLRAAKILKTVSDQYELEEVEDFTKLLFHFGGKTMRDRWEKLRAAVAASDAFSLPVFQPEYCNFMKQNTLPSPAFAWLKCERDIDDCESFLRQNHKILTRSGKHFGADAKYVRISMLDRAKTFDMFIERLSSIDR